MKRRVQQYGYKYSYKFRKVNRSMAIPWDNFLNGINKKISLVTEIISDQVIINEYLPGQGIGDHVDCIPCFSGMITSLSLCSSCVINFKRRNEEVNYLLEPRGLLIITGEARYEWTHGIKSVKKESYLERQIER